MAPANYQDSFRPEVWRALSLDDRVQLLQALENDYAQRFGRSTCVVTPVEMTDINDSGLFNSSTKAIEINRDHIQRNELMVSAIGTILHEGRHAYQWEAIATEGLHPDSDQVQLWRENYAVYVTHSETANFVYRFQAIERDADAYSEIELAKMFDTLEKRYGTNDVYQKFAQVAALEKQLISAKAKEVLGADFHVEIDKAIHRAFGKYKGAVRLHSSTETLYGKKQSEQSNKVYKISVQFDGFDWKSTHVVVQDKMNNADLKKHLSDEADKFIVREAGRMRVDINPATTQAKIEKLDNEQTLSFFRAKGVSKNKDRDLGIGF